MNDDGDTKDDVRMPDGEIGEKINKLFKVDEKDTSKSPFSPFLTPKSGTKMECILTQFSDVVVLTSMGEEAAIEAKEAPKQG